MLMLSPKKKFLLKFLKVGVTCIWFKIWTLIPLKRRVKKDVYLKKKKKELLQVN